MTKLEKQLTYDGRPENGGKITVEDLNRCQADNASPLRIVIPHYNGEPYAGLVANTFELCAAVRCVEAGKTFFIRQDVQKIVLGQTFKNDGFMQCIYLIFI